MYLTYSSTCSNLESNPKQRFGSSSARKFLASCSRSLTSGCGYPLKICDLLIGSGAGGSAAGGSAAGGSGTGVSGVGGSGVGESGAGAPVPPLYNYQYRRFVCLEGSSTYPVETIVRFGRASPNPPPFESRRISENGFRQRTRPRRRIAPVHIDSKDLIREEILRSVRESYNTREGGWSGLTRVHSLPEAEINKPGNANCTQIPAIPLI
jgi:hypothetical protein